MNTTNLKMYVDISVKNEGYFDDGQLSLKTANFKIKNANLKEKDNESNISKIENGIVYLKRIDANKNVTAVKILLIVNKISSFFQMQRYE